METTEAHELENTAIVLYEDKSYSLTVPQTPNIPLNEGIHITVNGQHNMFDSPKEVLSRYLLGLAGAKAVAESGITRDAWANTRLEKGNQVSVYGRVPDVENSWRRPVETHARGVTRLDTLSPYYDQQELKNLFGRYIPRWEALLGKMELFPAGVQGIDIFEDSGNEPVIWENDKFTLAVVRQPHLKGWHLVVHPKESQARQWMTVREEPGVAEAKQPFIQQTLEATAIAFGAQQLLASGRGEIHNSGNWAETLRVDSQPEGKFSLGGYTNSKKAEKRRHRPDIAAQEDQIKTSMHAHVYIPENPSDPVVLPPLSTKEIRERREWAEESGEDTAYFDILNRQWDAIPSITNEEIVEIREKIGNGRLTEWLKKHCQGKLEEAEHV